MSTRQELQQVIRLVQNGQLRPVVDRSYPFEQANEALQAVAEVKIFGRAVLDIPWGVLEWFTVTGPAPPRWRSCERQDTYPHRRSLVLVLIDPVAWNAFLPRRFCALARMAGAAGRP